VAGELHYRHLIADIVALVGPDEAERITRGRTIEELYDLEQRLMRQMMREPRAA
jgi:hypothetical protein